MNINMSNVGSSLTINGKSYTGQNIRIQNGKVIVDGKEQEGSEMAGPITVNVVGDVQSLHTVSGDVYVQGNAGSVQTVSGDVNCGPVQGNVNTVSGDINHS